MRTHLKRLMLGLAACSVLIASASAARTSYHRVHLPGVDHYGNLNSKYGGHAKLKLVCDTRHRTFCATAKSYVRNSSGYKQSYYGRLAVGLQHLAYKFRVPLHAIRITKDHYTVDRGSYFHHHKARCCAIVCGRISADPYENGDNGPA